MLNECHSPFFLHNPTCSTRAPPKVTMRSAVALLGLMLATAQAFYVPVQTRNSAVNAKPSFFGQSVASRNVATARPTQLRASLEDIEKRLLEQVYQVVCSRVSAVNFGGTAFLIPSYGGDRRTVAGIFVCCTLVCSVLVRVQSRLHQCSPWVLFMLLSSENPMNLASMSQKICF